MGLKNLVFICIAWKTNPGRAVDHAVEVEIDTLGADQASDFFMGREHGQCHNRSIEVWYWH